MIVNYKEFKKVLPWAPGVWRLRLLEILVLDCWANSENWVYCWPRKRHLDQLTVWDSSLGSNRWESWALERHCYHPILLYCSGTNPRKPKPSDLSELLAISSVWYPSDSSSSGSIRVLENYQVPVPIRCFQPVWGSPICVRESIVPVSYWSCSWTSPKLSDSSDWSKPAWELPANRCLSDWDFSVCSPGRQTNQPRCSWSCNR